MKRTIPKHFAAALAAAAIVAAAVTPALADSEGTFPDVPEDAPYVQAVEALAELGIFTGDDQGNFNPDKTITRAEAATVLCCMLGVDGEARGMTEKAFDDLPDGFWGTGFVAKAAELGVISGYGDGRFGPFDPVTKEQMLTMLVSAWGYREDALSSGGWPDGFIAAAKNLGIADSGETDLKLPAKRWEVAVWCYNALSVDSYVEG